MAGGIRKQINGIILVSLNKSGGGHKVGRYSVAGRCQYTMTVHFKGSCLRSITPVSAWYSLVGIPIGVDRVYGPNWTSLRLGHPSRLKIGRLAGPLSASTAASKYSRGHVGREQIHIPPEPDGSALRNG